eukprot:scaffold201940_cov31-Tisochrysis_lutea.AAC.1
MVDGGILLGQSASYSAPTRRRDDARAVTLVGTGTQHSRPRLPCSGEYAQHSRGLAHPPAGDRAVVVDDLAVGRPAELDRISGVDAAGARISRWAEPVLLWCRSGARADAGVSRAADGVSKNFVDELSSEGGSGSVRKQQLLVRQRSGRGVPHMRVVRDDACGEMIFHAVEHLEDERQLILLVTGDDLEGSEKLGRCERKVVVGRHDGLNGDVYRRWLNGSVAVGDGVTREGGPTKGELGTRQLEARLNVREDSRGRPG